MKRVRGWESTEEEELQRLRGRKRERAERDGVRERERGKETDTHTGNRTQGQHHPSSQPSQSIVAELKQTQTLPAKRTRSRDAGTEKELLWPQRLKMF